jgi:hypothetical protein
MTNTETRDTHLTKTTTHTSPKRPGIRYLSKTYNPYYEHSGARQHEQQ